MITRVTPETKKRKTPDPINTVELIWLVLHSNNSKFSLWKISNKTHGEHEEISLPSAPAGSNLPFVPVSVFLVGE